jgi:hypothetical protein
MRLGLQGYGHSTNATCTQSLAVSPLFSPAPSSASTLLRVTLLRTSAPRLSRTSGSEQDIAEAKIELEVCSTVFFYFQIQD